MSEHTGPTDQTHTIQLTSTIEQVMWSRTLGVPGGQVDLEVYTHYVGDNATMEIELTDHAGTSHGSYANKLYGNFFKVNIVVPPEAKQALYAEVTLPDHGLTKKSAPLFLLPPIEVVNAKWDRPEVNQGDVVKLTADAKGAPDGMEAEIFVYEKAFDGALEKITQMVTLVDGEKIDLDWEYLYPGEIVVPPTPEIEAGTAKDRLEADYVFEVVVAGIKAVSEALKFTSLFPTVKPKWSKAEVTPDHNSAWPPASPPTDAVPEEAKVEMQVDTTQVPDGTAATITVHHCHTGALIPGGTVTGLTVQGNKVVDGAGNVPVWTFNAAHLPWDPWDKPFFFFKVQLRPLGFQAETPSDYVNKEAETLRVKYWHICVSDAIADTPAGGNLTTQAEMAEIAGIMTGQAHHAVGQQAVNQNNVPVALWGSLLRNAYAYHHASHGDIVDRTTGAQLNAPDNPPNVPVGNWRSVVVLGSTDLGDVETNQAANVPSVPRYLVYMDTCVAGWEPSLANAFVNRGTRNYLAFRCYIPDGDARQMARDFYNKWCGTHKCDPTKIPTVFFDVGAPYYNSMRPVLFGAGGGAVPAPQGALSKALDAIGSAIGSIISGIGSLFK